MGDIYVIKNTFNNKVYVGQTIDTPERRMIKHRSEAKRYARGLENPELRNKRGTCSKLYRAMNKYGIENFFMEVVDREDDQENLDIIEEYYILVCNSVENGYNLKYGGDSSRHCEETKKIISERTKVGIAKNIDNHRTHEVVKGMPVGCVYVVIKGSPAIAINKHPNCQWKSFTVRKYGTIENVKIEVLKFIDELNKI